MNQRAVFIAIGYTYDMGRGGAAPQVFEETLGSVPSLHDGVNLIDRLGFKSGVVLEVYPASIQHKIKGVSLMHPVKIDVPGPEKSAKKNSKAA